ncbi:splicing factor 45-like isoform X3 [Littorina saxatilis]|uniref:splicing factor 45-like isoform X3 n=1 Tax=Littorina saxatilis TaxID=31220 RepID=UPI0038B54CE8
MLMSLSSKTYARLTLPEIRPVSESELPVVSSSVFRRVSAMSLYDGLDIDNKETTSSTKTVPGWSPGYKLLQSQLQAKKALLVQNKRQRQSVLAPVVDLKSRTDDGPLSFNLQTGKIERAAAAMGMSMSPASLGISAPFIASEAIPSFTGVADEYNPLVPNEYEELVKKKKEKKDEERRKDNEERRQKRGPGDGKELDSMRKRKEEEEEEEIDRSRGGGGGAAIAPPPSVLEDTEVKGSASVDKPEGMNMLNSVATKIMAKYGYREGQGLGKSEQGMSTALYVEKTSKRGGKIIHEKDLPKVSLIPESLAFKEPSSNTNIMKNPSKVIMLTNMVGPGEVDEELEPETAEECTKYGKVTKVVIYEVPDVVEEEAVRIFIEFDRMESAIKAVVDLNGRYFGGRIVRGSFYNLDKFRRLDLISPVE